MEVHDIRAALSSLPMLTITSSTTAAEAYGPFISREGHSTTA